MFCEKFTVTPADIPNEGVLFVDHSLHDRSGHLGHGLVEYAPSKVIAFYPDCSAVDPRFPGHSGHGWMRFKRSYDGGSTWTQAEDEVNSKRSYDQTNGVRTLFIEKAVVTDTGRIVVFYLQCDMTVNGHIWEPYGIPQFAYSDDCGENWTPEMPFLDEPGRIYDAVYKDGVIYAMFAAGKDVIGQKNTYYLVVSTDNGESWEIRSTIGYASTQNCFYGALMFTPEGKLMAYCYEETDEQNLKYITSDDNGKTWSEDQRSFFKNRIRNPQIAYFNGRYILHGRSGNYGDPEKAGHFILYTAQDGIHWDEGHYMRMREACAGSYSNNLIVHTPDGRQRLLIQTSHAYEEHKTNILHFFLDKKTE